MSSNSITRSIPGFNKFAIILIFAFVLNLFFGMLAAPFFARVFYAEDQIQYDLSVHTVTLISLVIEYLIHIIIAIWIYRLAKDQKERPAIWVLFALVFGLMALIIFYLVLLFREVKALNEKISGKEGAADSRQE